MLNIFFWNLRRNLNRDETPNWMVTKDANGVRILDPEQNKENVAAYYEGLYKKVPVPPIPTIRK